MRRANRVEHHLAQLGLGWGEGQGLPFPAFRWYSRQNELVGHEVISPLTILIIVGNNE
jgi:hypothetical protein